MIPSVQVRKRNSETLAAPINARCDPSSYEFDGDLGCEGEDVSAGDDARARVLQRGLDVVDHREAARRVVVGGHGLLGLDRREVVVQQKRAVATLKHLAFVACQISDALRVPIIKHGRRRRWCSR